MSKKKPLTDREHDVLSIINEHSKVKRPSVRTIARFMGVKSPATIQKHINNLKYKGWIV